MTNKCISQKLIYWLACCTLLGLFLPMSVSAADSPVGVAYRGHIQDLGDYPSDGSWVDSPEIIGTEGQSKRIEGFEIKLTGAIPTDLQNGLELRYNVHVQNKGWLYDENDSTNWPKDGDYAGTRGESLRIEAVKIVLTDADGKTVSGYSVQYRGHVQNVGNLPTDESQWLADGAQLGTVGSSLRLEALLVKVVPKESDLTAYNTLLLQIEKLNEGDYRMPTWKALQTAVRTHVVTAENTQTEVEAAMKAIQGAYGGLEKVNRAAYNDLVAKIEKLNEMDFTTKTWAVLQTALKAHLVTADQSQTEVDAAVKAIQSAYDGLEKKAVPTVYDKAGTFGPATGTQTIAGEVIIKADGVILQNLKIEGNLTIAEAVGNGTVTLNNVTVVGDTFVRGGGANSIHINGGQYSRIVMEKTATGAVRIVATGVDGLDVVIAEDAAGETIILEGAFDSVVVNAPNMAVTTQGSTTTIGKMTVGKEATGSTVNLAVGTTVTDLLLDAKAAIKGQGTVAKAEVKADGVTFDKAPGSYTVEPGVVIPPVFPAPDNGGGGGGGYYPPAPIAVTGVSLNKTVLTLSLNASENLVATVAPTDATNKAVSWTTSDGAVASVAADGKVTANKEGTATITVTTQDGNKTAACAVTVKNLNPAITGLTVPFHGDTPDATIVDTNQYSGTVAWREQGGGTDLLATDAFDGAKTYVATITLAMKAPYTAADIPANFFTVDGKAAVNSAGIGVITLAFSSVPQYRINSSGVITAYSGPAGAVEIPNTIVTPGGAIAVTGIGESAFENRGLTAITLPETVTKIGDYAFENNSLTELVIPDQVTTIGDYAFFNNFTLSSVILPDPLTINILAFYADPITRISIGDGANIHTFPGTMGEFGNAFADYYNNAIAGKPAKTAGHYIYTNGDWEIDNGLTFSGSTITGYDQSKGPYVFIPAKNGGTAVTTFKDGDIPGGVSGVFEQMYLKTVTFASDSAIMAIGDYAFARNLLEVINIPDTVTTIKGGAFTQNEKLKNVTLSANLISIGIGAFEACALESIELPDHLTTIGDLAFDDNQLRNTLTIPASVTTIGNSAFEDNLITSLVIEGETHSLTIGRRAFGSTGAGNPIIRITLPDGVTIVENDIIHGSSTMGLYGAKFQDAYSVGGAGTYNYDSGTDTWIKEIIAVGGISPVVGATAAASTATDTRFTGSVVWTETNDTMNTSVTSFTANKAYTATITLTPKTPYVFSDRIVFTVAGGTIKLSTINGDGTASIIVDFPYTISAAGVITCYNGTGGDVSIPDKVNGKTVTGIGPSVFKDNNSITKVIIPATVTSIGDFAFQNCTALTAVDIPDAVTGINLAAFMGCSALQTVEFSANSNLTIIENSAFNGCSTLESIIIPAKVSFIYDAAFMNCSNLTAVTFAGNNDLTTLHDCVFLNCVKLTEITIPMKVSSIEGAAFRDYTNKRTGLTITFLGNTPTSLESNAIPKPGTTIRYYENYTSFASWTGYTLVPILAAPGNLTATVAAGTSDAVKLTWNAVSGATKYQLYSGLSTAEMIANGLPLAALATDNQATITGLTPGTTYFFGVKAMDSIGESLISTPVSTVMDKPVTVTDIQGVTIPAVGATPVATITADPQYDGTVTWSNAGGSFSSVFTGSKAFTATITLTAKTGYVFPENISFNVDGTTSPTTVISNAGKTATITAAFPLPETAQFTISNAGMITAFYGASDAVTIPDMVNMIPVTAIGDSVFAKTNDEFNSGVKSITAVTIPATVTAIGTSVFQNCANLTTVTFTGTSALKTIGAHAFDSCNNLKPFEIPASVTSIGNGAFNACNAFNTAKFAAGSQLTEIGNGAFNGSTITTITIPAGVATIVHGAFNMCNSLTTVEFPADSALKTIESGAFVSCPLMTIRNLPAGVLINTDNNTMGDYGDGFTAVYETPATGGAGTYTYNDPTWSK